MPPAGREPLEVDVEGRGRRRGRRPRFPSLRVTTIGSPTRRQPWRTPNAERGVEAWRRTTALRARARCGTGRALHAEVVAAQPPTSGTPAPTTRRRPHDLGLVADEAVGEEQEHPVRVVGEVCPARRRRGRWPPRPRPPGVGPRRRRRRGGDGEARPPRAVTTTRVARPGGGISPAVEHRSAACRRHVADPGQELVEVVALAAEHDEQFGVLAGERLGGGLLPGPPARRSSRTGRRPASALPRGSGECPQSFTARSAISE